MYVTWIAETLSILLFPENKIPSLIAFLPSGKLLFSNSEPCRIIKKGSPHGQPTISKNYFLEALYGRSRTAMDRSSGRLLGRTFWAYHFATNSTLHVLLDERGA